MPATDKTDQDSSAAGAAPFEPTEGPWRVQKDGDRILADVFSPVSPGGKMTVTIASVWNRIGNQKEANARLIAAGPDLLKENRAMLAALESFKTICEAVDDDPSKRLDDIWTQTKRLIASARAASITTA